MALVYHALFRPSHCYEGPAFDDKTGSSSIAITKRMPRETSRKHTPKSKSSLPITFPVAKNLSTKIVAHVTKKS
jgi:hypothetical protein